MKRHVDHMWRHRPGVEIAPGTPHLQTELTSSDQSHCAQARFHRLHYVTLSSFARSRILLLPQPGFEYFGSSCNRLPQYMLV